MTDLVKRSTEVLYSSLDSAIAILERFGIVPLEDETSQLAYTLQDLVEVDETAVTAIANVLQNQSAVIRFMNEEMEQIKVADRHADITDRFGNIVKDLTDMRAYLQDDGKIDLGEKLSLLGRKVIRGDTQHQFEEIHETHLEVTGDTVEHLQKQETIIEAYDNFKGAFQEAGIIATQLLRTQAERLYAAQEEAAAAVETFKEYEGDDETQQMTLRVERDRALGRAMTEQNRYNLAGFVVQGFDEGQLVAETVMTHYRAQHQQLKDMSAKSITFFQTHALAFAGLEGSVLGAQANHEATQVQKAQREGSELVMKALEEIGVEGMPEYMRELHGPGIAAERVIGLLEGVEAYIHATLVGAEEYRRARDKNTAEIREAMDASKDRTVQMLGDYAKAQIKAHGLIEQKAQ